jgi:hypothetical protein
MSRLLIAALRIINCSVLNVRHQFIQLPSELGQSSLICALERHASALNCDQGYNTGVARHRNGSLFRSQPRKLTRNSSRGRFGTLPDGRKHSGNSGRRCKYLPYERRPIRLVTACDGTNIPDARAFCLAETNSIAEIDSTSYLTALCNDLIASVQKPDGSSVALKLDIDNEPLPTDRALPLGLVVNELLTNAIKYAFPEERGGTVGVTFKRAPAGPDYSAPLVSWHALLA